MGSSQSGSIAEAQAAIARVGEIQGAAQYDGIAKFHEAMSILMGGPEEAARRAELKRRQTTGAQYW